MSVTLNRARAPDQRRVLVEIDDTDTATTLARSTIDTSVETGVADGRIVIDETAAPHDADVYIHPQPVPDPGP